MANHQYIFEKLTPIEEVELTIYEDAINFIFENQDIKNIAISGPYGAGKSSVLASYKKKHADLKFIHISLAHFQSPNDESSTVIKESLLEGKILNQLIHQIPSGNIPQTNFRVKKTADTKKVILNTAAIVLFVLLLLHIIFYNNWSKYVDSLQNNWFKDILNIVTLNNYSLIVNILLMSIIFSTFLYFLIDAQQNKNIFRKLNIQGNEIEIFEECDDSYFDKYLNEVLYLFENVEADVVIFEDMDRFDATCIFERLKEVNTLVNLQLKKEKKKSLRFFYLLRDDIFVSKDRTKIFDYIIPVIPVVDSSNSYDQFLEHFRKNNLINKFNQGFLQGLSLYIDDMRLLKNICNEFLIYFYRLNKTELDYNKMLALVTYKNLFPRDFSELQLNQGFVYALFSHKKQFTENEIANLQKEIINMKARIDNMKKEHLTSLEELETIFEVKRTTPWGNKRELTQEEKQTFSSRQQIISDSSNGEILNIESNISKLTTRKTLLLNQPLSKTITRKNINFIFNITTKNEIGIERNYNEIKASKYFDSLKYLIRNGYLDETYADYMTYFHENRISCIDKNFLRSITDKKSKEYRYQLRNPELVISRLTINDFDQEEILNFSLFTYLLQNIPFSNSTIRLITQLRDNKNFGFISQYFDITSEIQSYIENLNSIWPEVFMEMLKGNELSPEKLHLYSIYTLYYSDENSIKNINIDNCLVNYISKSERYLSIDEPLINKLTSAFEFLHVTFLKIDYATANKELFLEVYKKSMYVLNFDNIKLILQKIYKIENEEDILHKNYSLITSISDSPLNKYISHNIASYMDIILVSCGKYINDDEVPSLSLLNNSNISIEQKFEYMHLLETPIVKIKSVTDTSLWPKLLDETSIVFSEKNIMEYFCLTKKLDDQLINFINQGSGDLDFSKIENEFNEEDRKNLFVAIIDCNTINNSRYEQIIATLGFRYELFNVPDISMDKIKIIIDHDRFDMNEDNLLFMRENYSDTIIYFIHQYIHEYISIMNENLFSHSELINILSMNIDDGLKIQLLEFEQSPISIIGKDYSNAVCAYLLTYNLNDSDMEDLLISYESMCPEVQKAIVNYAIQHVSRIIDNPESASIILKDQLIHSQSNSISDAHRIDLFISMLPEIDENSILNYIDYLRLFGYEDIFNTRKRPTFLINEQNTKLLEAFKKKGLISDYLKSPNKPEYFKIQRNKIRIKNNI